MDFDFFEGYKPNTSKKTKLEVIDLLKRRILMFKKIEARLPNDQVEQFGKSKCLEKLLNEMEAEKVKPKKSIPKPVNIDRKMII